MTVPGAAHALEPFGEALGAGRTLGEPVEPDDDATAAEGDEPDALDLSLPPLLGVAGGEVEVHAPRLRTVEHEATIHLEERKVRADEDRVVRGVLHLDLDGAPVAVEHDGALSEQDLARLHRARASDAGRIGCSTCSTRIPSPKRHSIFTVPISSGTPSITSSVVSARRPAS